MKIESCLFGVQQNGIRVATASADANVELLQAMGLIWLTLLLVCFMLLLCLLTQTFILMYFYHVSKHKTESSAPGETWRE